VSAVKIVPLADFRIQNQMQIGGIDIAVSKNGILCQRSK
jgi:hypothetical protein